MAFVMGSRATGREKAQARNHGIRPRYEDNSCGDSATSLVTSKICMGSPAEDIAERKSGKSIQITLLAAILPIRKPNWRKFWR